MIKIIVMLLLVLISIFQNVQSTPSFPSKKRFDCKKDVPTMPLNLKHLAGIWYEAGRVPKMDIMKCLNISVPEEAANILELQLEYISTMEDDTKIVKETIEFPMDNFTMNSIFNLFYDSHGRTIIVTYKVVYTDYKVLTLLCGFSGISPIPLFKILSRQRQLNQESIDRIQGQVDEAGFTKVFMWTEQAPDQCNTALRPAVGLLTIWILSFGICSNGVKN